MFLITASENTSKLKQNASCRKLNVQMTINLKTNCLLKKNNHMQTMMIQKTI